MKKSALFCLLMILALFNGGQEQKKEPQKVYKLTKAYVYQEESLLISETDLNCSFLISTDDLAADIEIMASERSDGGQTQFSDGDRLFINRGAADGLKEGDILQIIAEGRVIRHPSSSRYIGRYYLKKSLAEVTCLYERQAVITLKNCCHPVRIRDLAFPYTPPETVFKRKLIYNLCRIPARSVFGSVIYLDLYINTTKNIAGDASYVAVDQGKSRLAKGQFLLFYRRLSRKLPLVIIGLGIVIHCEDSNSTVKILDAADAIKAGDNFCLLPETRGEIPTEGELPLLEAGETPSEVGAESLTIDLLYDLNSNTPKDDPTPEIEKIKNFLADKSEYLIILRGYCCSIGTDEYNLKLAQERVENIKNLLISQAGVDAAHIETNFYGETEPPADNTSEIERRKNRLVKIEVNGK